MKGSTHLIARLASRCGTMWWSALFILPLVLLWGMPATDSVVGAPIAAFGDADARDASARRGKEESDRNRTARRAAIERGCKYLASQEEYGRFGESRATVAITSLSVLALMAQGSTDHRGPYRAQIRRGIDFLVGLIERPKPDRYSERQGYFFHAQDQDSRMHGQGFATLALACALGTSDRKRSARIRNALRLAVRTIEGSQAKTGGFGYEPHPANDHEGSVTVAVAQGLRAARDAGLIVNANVVARGLKYLHKSQKGDGSFQYSLHRPHSSYALTAAALSSLFLYGEYSDRNGSIKKGLQYMRRRIEHSGAEHPWYYYGHFYAAWALWQWDGNDWSRGPTNQWGYWQSVVYPHLMKKQRATDGSFEQNPGRFDYGPILTTAFAVLTLSIPDETLPIFQR